MKKHVFILSLFVIVFAACSYHQGKERRNIVAPPKVHRKYESKCDEKKVVEKDKLQETHKLQSLVEKDTSWYGHYEYYMQASDYPPIFVGYELEISPDSCIFTGNGQMTYFRILCTVSKKNENRCCTVVLYYAILTFYCCFSHFTFTLFLPFLFMI